MSRLSLLSYRSSGVRSMMAAALCVVAATALGAPRTALADDTLPQVANGPNQYAGAINSDDVYVRSGPGDNFYATSKLDKGAPVVVVGIHDQWLKILPPQGSFSYVAKAYVDKTGDGSTGRVTRSELNVRAGSDLNAMKTAVQTKLDQNQSVQIIGDQDEYFKIKPPQGVYLYVNKMFVDPVKKLTAMKPAPSSAEPLQSAPVLPMMSHTPQTTAGANAQLSGVPTTQPSGLAMVPSTQPALAKAPTTQPIAPSVVAQNQFDATEASFLQATDMPIDKQPIDKLLLQYDNLAKNSHLPSTMQKIADIRVKTLQIRMEARDQYEQAMKMEAAAQSRELSLKAERQELAQRIKRQTITMYTALGTLRTSSLQESGATLYRLTDPNTGHTLLYIRSNDPQYANLLNQFIGVRGNINDDAAMSLKVMTPTVAEKVDPLKVNKTIMAQVIPPSMLPKSATSNVVGN